jgi:DNA-binding HxlR family transcriptional regulator
MPSGKDTPRSNCPMACALDLLRDRWTLVVLRDVLLDQRRTFSEIATVDGLRRTAIEPGVR